MVNILYKWDQQKHNYTNEEMMPSLSDFIFKKSYKF